MADQRKGGIAWCDFTFNPWWGCQRVSEGCRNCYAAGFAKRTGLGWGPSAERRFFGDAHWRKPEQWNVLAKRDGVRRRVFCASMADVFEDRDDIADARARLWALIARTPALDWLLLTKRPDNVQRMVPPTWDHAWPAHAWLGFTAEDQAHYDRRWPSVAAMRGPAIKFCSYEPAIGALSLRVVDGQVPDWVIVGGESGPQARPFDLAWARDVIRQCREAAVPCFVKQLGRNAEDPSRGIGAMGFPGDREGREMHRWDEDLRVREYPPEVTR